MKQWLTVCLGLLLWSCVAPPSPWVPDQTDRQEDVRAETGARVNDLAGDEARSESDLKDRPDSDLESSDGACVPDCTGRECGSDGCGGSCGTCSAAQECAQGTCVPVIGICGNGVCGEEEDCTSCPEDCKCESGSTCVTGACVECAAYCEQAGFTCGTIGACACGGCDLGEVCQNHACVCAPQCAGKNCGSDGCGGSCGACSPPTICDDGACVHEMCLSGEILIADPVLEALVREAAGVPTGPLTLDDVKGVPQLTSNCPEGGPCISDLEGIQCLTQLTVLSLTGHEFPDVEPLAFLVNLKDLNIQNNLVSDFTPLGTLTALENLGVGESSFSDLSILAGLNLLEYLYANWTEVSVLDGIESLPGLNHLSLFGVQDIVSYLPLNDAPSLVSLDLGQSGLTTLTVLSGPGTLEALQVPFNSLTDLDGIEVFPELTQLDAEECGLTDITSISFLPELSHLDLAGNEITDLNPLVSHPGLGPGDMVDLTGNPLDCEQVSSDLQFLKNAGVNVLSDCN